MIKAGIASAIFLMSSTAAHADQYGDMTSYLKFMNTPIDILHDSVTNADYIIFAPASVVNGGKIIHEARVDYTLGIVCEWDLFIKKGENQIQNTRCLEEGDKAPPWLNAYQNYPRPKILLSENILGPITNSESLGLIFEGAVAKDYYDDRYLTTKTWVLGKDEVCIKIGRDFDVTNDEILTVDLGCHEIWNQEYRDNLMYYMGIHPA